jgi:phospholipase/carboxylesterase
MTKESIGNSKVLYAGCITNPSSALVLLHGRGATAESIMALASHLVIPKQCVVIAPQAIGNTWYPHRFLESQETNEPYLSIALGTIDVVFSHLHDHYQLDTDRVVLAGFSQGACVVSEYLKQRPRRYGGAAIMSGGLIGSDVEASLLVGNDSSLRHTPVYIGCDINDAHIPVARVLLTEKIVRHLGADVAVHLYEDLGHVVHADAFDFLSQCMQLLERVEAT